MSLDLVFKLLSCACSCWRPRRCSTSSVTTTSCAARSPRASCSTSSTVWPRTAATFSTSTSSTPSSRPRASTWRSVRTWSWPRWGWERDEPSCFWVCRCWCDDVIMWPLCSWPTQARTSSSSTTTRRLSTSCWSWWQRAGRESARAARSGNHGNSLTLQWMEQCWQAYALA